MFISSFLCGDVIAIVGALLALLIGFFKWKYQYWRRRNLPYLEPTIPYGNLKSPFRSNENIGVTIMRCYQQIKNRNWKHGGIYFIISPAYFVVNLDYVKNIMTKDFKHFPDRGFYHNEKDDPISAHLFAIGGTKWRNLRTKLNPTFTPGKIKMMFQTLVDCETNLQHQMKMECESKKPIDIKEIFACFTSDVIGSCAFGLDFNTSKQASAPFRACGKEALVVSKFRAAKSTFCDSFPQLAKNLGVTITPKEISSFFMKVVKNTVDHREKNNYTRKDFMQLLIDLKNNKLAEEEGYKHDGQTLTVEEIAAQSFAFFFASFETSSITMTFALYELAKNQDIQQKVRDEINTILERHDGKITYESVQDLKYMNQVINETLRKYPPAPLIMRKCVKDYKIPDEDIIINKGTKVVISILGIHHDEEYYPDPEKFDPERFSEEAKHSRHHYAYIPFGEGPRICIGMRFGWMQSKVGLVSLLKNYKFTVNRQTKEPLTFQVDAFVLAAEGDIWLDAHKI